MKSLMEGLIATILATSPASLTTFALYERANVLNSVASEMVSTFGTLVIDNGAPLLGLSPVLQVMTIAAE